MTQRSFIFIFALIINQLQCLLRTIIHLQIFRKLVCVVGRFMYAVLEGGCIYGLRLYALKTLILPDLDIEILNDSYIYLVSLYQKDMPLEPCPRENNVFNSTLIPHGTISL